jgi:hypothetical protein
MKKTKKAVKPINTARVPLRMDTETGEPISIIQYHITDSWISLNTIPDEADRPDLSMLHSIIKYNIRLIEALAGFKGLQIIEQVVKDIKHDNKDRAKFAIDGYSDDAIKDEYKVEVETFKRYK